MSGKTIQPSGRERTFAEDEIIVSKTDTKGRMTYVNDVFLSVSGFTEAEVIGQPHSMIRHPDMPRCVFKLLWDTIASGKELFAYVVNLAKTGEHYWVLAHVTPDFGPDGQIVGYHSNRRVPRRDALAKIQPLYQSLLKIEEASADRKQGMEAAFAALVDQLKREGKPYAEFVLGL
ncbi:putative sensor (PAS) domain for methyl-accepting chemotaxis sensory transducer [Paramagnetospirillum magnetotacticum MS-1]|uniref:Putative sensor (PAS) domain for methyl-accepting chemotaxis sensory transducer n=1 Tax=Paramagnetospirillum magnetotacticum MS-1 TaxID=272627 RepID=A0A0C2V3M8_PARME|nr:PAS domain-containing protein [Paramagnetospirillum magnetotacticum]KIL99661.1 putative sensor (PAS) domain for methyl-accepting chemotaxis sensory transducer [Paramagnetospirillum magnetotacticum MS-1]